jgi:hypothetical protein
MGIAEDILKDAIVDDPRGLRRIKTQPADEGEPIKGDITFGAFANPLLKQVLAQFGKPAFARSAACMEFEAFLRRINAGGKTCLEIGTYQGITALVLSQFFEQVICVSVDEDKSRIIKYDIVEFLDIENIRFIDVENNEAKRKAIEGLEFDFAFSDGDHVNDTLDDFDLVKRCGRVLLHEYWPLQPPVWNLVNSLPPDEITRACFDCFAYWERKGG